MAGPTHIYFAQSEAQAKIRKRVRVTGVELLSGIGQDVPIGALGQVTDCKEANIQGWEVVISWNSHGLEGTTRVPKSQYETYLEEM